MGSSLRPVLANIILTELEDVTIKALIVNGTIKLYSCLDDDTLLIMKPGNFSQLHNALNLFHKKLCYADDMSESEVPHFLDLEVT